MPVPARSGTLTLPTLAALGIDVTSKGGFEARSRADGETATEEKDYGEAF